MGPARVLDAGDSSHAFQVQMLGDEKVMQVHSTRLRHYSDKHLHVTEELKEHVASELEEFYEVEQILDVDYLDGAWKFYVSWEGFEDRTWEPVETLYRDCEEMVESFVLGMEDKKLRNRVRKALNF